MYWTAWCNVNCSNNYWEEGGCSGPGVDEYPDPPPCGDPAACSSTYGSQGCDCGGPTGICDASYMDYETFGCA